jgi:hypothetical protein
VRLYEDSLGVSLIARYEAAKRSAHSKRRQDTRNLQACRDVYRHEITDDQALEDCQLRGKFFPRADRSYDKVPQYTSYSVGSLCSTNGHAR